MEENKLFPELTPQETKVLLRYASGGSLQDVAKDLGMAKGTIFSHKRVINAKLGIKSQLDYYKICEQRKAELAS